MWFDLGHSIDLGSLVSDALAVSTGHEDSHVTCDMTGVTEE